jgi:LysR family glycine cleavage system transcriptional activator
MTPSSRIPPLKALRAFQVAGEHLSFKLAAEELCVTASAVSHQVKKLESFLGFDLFERRTRAIAFTEAGKNYHEFLSGMFARLETETHQVRAEFGRSIIRLCVPPFFAQELLMPRLDDLEALVPGTDIRLFMQPSLMKAHPADADLSILLGSGDWPELDTTLLFRRRILTACSPAFKKAEGLRRYRDLDGLTLIVHENRPNSWTNWARAVNTTPPRPAKVLRFDSMAAVVQAAAQGLGVAIVSWPLSERWFREGALVPALNDRVVTDESFYLACRPEDSEREDIAALRGWITSEFGSNPGGDA